MRREIVTCRLVVPEVDVDRLSVELTHVINAALGDIGDFQCELEQDSEIMLAWHLKVPESNSTQAENSLRQAITKHLRDGQAETRFEVYRWGERYGRRSESLSDVEGSEEAVANNQRLFFGHHPSPRTALELEKF